MGELTFNDDSKAWEYLEKRGYTEEQFVIQLPVRRMTQGEWNAVGYLVNEWDWDSYDTRKDLKGIRRWVIFGWMYLCRFKRKLVGSKGWHE